MQKIIRLFILSLLLSEPQLAKAAEIKGIILMPLPSYGFDPTEASIPWKMLTQAGFNVRFATPDGSPALADNRMVTGAELPAPLKSSLMADPGAVHVYHEMINSEEFQHPMKYEDIRSVEFKGLVLSGGHDKGMRPYLESSILQKLIGQFFFLNQPVAAICHGTLLVARSPSLDPARQGKSVLWGRKTTGLTRMQELSAFYLTQMWLGDYYRTYETPMADEVRWYLSSPSDFLNGPERIIPIQRDSESNLAPGFTVRNGNYLSARWPGDAHRFASDFIKILNGQK